MSVREESRGSLAASATRRRRKYSWNAVLWALVYPQRVHRILPTLPGLVLIALSFGIGTAAYNSSSNILFITLSLLLACLILSGVLSWLNLRRVHWRLRLTPPMRAGHDTLVVLELENRKSFLPTYGLWFEFSARGVEPAHAQRAESTVTAKGAEVRAALAKADQAEMRDRRPLRGRLDPGGESRIEWVFKPQQRGVVRVKLASVGSLFPFGFLRKEIGTDLVAEAVVWPAPVEYRRHAIAATRRTAGGERVARAGAGGDLLALRRYAIGDSHRLIHWKASARTGQLLVRQFAAESAQGFVLWLQTDAAVWPRPEQFEHLVSFAATLAEDLFRAGKLNAVTIDAEPPAAVRRVHDLELFLNKLAIVQPRQPATASSQNGDDWAAAAAALVGKRNVLTFSPEGARGVATWMEGQMVATA